MAQDKRNLRVRIAAKVGATGEQIRGRSQCEATCEKYDHGIRTISVPEGEVRKMAAGTFKANCLAVIDEVQAKHETVVITKHGKPVAKLVPVNKATDEIYNFLSDKGAISGGVVSPVISPEDWGELT